MTISYRSDIDGLRAIAVLSVIGFHAFPALIPGGFVGVDVFFVISGYLITRILLSESASVARSIVKFYARRILRIFPALILVLMACFVMGWFTLLASEYKQLGKHIMAGAGFFSNFALWFEAGYFDNVSEAKPLLHLWSLGIEEQFYIVWPLILLGIFRDRKTSSKWMVAGLVVSLVFASTVVFYDRTQAFYSPLSRAWELLSGALLGYQQSRRSWPLPWLEHRVASVVGLSLIAVSVFCIRSSYVFPGALALLPVAGAFLLIGARQSSWVNAKVLSNPVLVNVGLISYPLYLWHWPAISFATIMESGQPEMGLRLVLVIACFVLATLTYQLIEKPVRRIPRKLAIGLLVSLMAFIGLLGKNVYDRDGLERIRHKHMITLSEEARRDFIDFEQTGLIPDIKCARPFQLPGKEFCLTAHPGRAPTVALIGDSHALHAYWGLSNAFDRLGQNLILLGRGACVPLLDHKRGRDEDRCQPHINNTLNNVADDPNIQGVVLVFRGRYLRNDADPVSIALFKNSLERTLQMFQAAGKKVYYFLPVVEPGFDPKLCLGGLPLGRKAPVTCEISLRHEQQEMRSNRDAARGVLVKFPTVQIIDPNDYLCKNDTCPLLIQGHSLFKDDNHLSYSGSLFIGAAINFDSIPPRPVR